MIELSDVKCPKCGEKIQVNKKLEKTICQYCGNTILIKDAVEQMPVSNKIQIDGIETRDEKFEKALKHIEFNEYNKAHDILIQIVEKDEFDIEAYAYLLYCKVKWLNNSNFSGYTEREDDADRWGVLDSIIRMNNRLNIIDKEKKSSKILEDVKNDIENYYKMADKYINDDNLLREYCKRINEVTQKFIKNSEEAGKDWKSPLYKAFADCFHINSNISYITDSTHGGTIKYIFNSIKKIDRAGNLWVTYECRDIFDFKIDRFKQQFKKISDLYKATSIGEISMRYQKFLQYMEQLEENNKSVFKKFWENLKK